MIQSTTYEFKSFNYGNLRHSLIQKNSKVHPIDTEKAVPNRLPCALFSTSNRYLLAFLPSVLALY